MQLYANLLMQGHLQCQELTPAMPGADNVDLGTACGKLHRVSVLAITDPGGSMLSRLIYSFHPPFGAVEPSSLKIVPTTA